MPSPLQPNGADIWYVDESADASFSAITAVPVPFLRREPDGSYTVVWEEEVVRAFKFRSSLESQFGLNPDLELHAVKLASGRGKYGKNGTRLGKSAGSALYRAILQRLDGLIEPSSVITVIAAPGSTLYGRTRLEAALYALFQRMQRASSANKRSGMVFFDEGHNEYRTMFRAAKVSLPTGSQYGSWNGAPTVNAPMTHFFKDANFKDSKHCPFTQAADLIAYAALVTARGRHGGLTPWQSAAGLGKAYEDIPEKILNKLASGRCPLGRGIVWL